MKSVYFGAPAILCGFASFVALVGLGVSSKTKLAQAVLYAFLPGCFLLTGAIMMLMQREIRRLRRRVARLEGRKKSSSRQQVASSEGTLAHSGERNGYGPLPSLPGPAKTTSPAAAASDPHTVAF